MKLKKIDIAEIVHEHKILVLVSALGFLIFLLLIAILLFIYEKKSSTMQPADDFITLDASLLQLPEEPLDLPPIHYSRKQKKIWTDADLAYWYTIPNAEQMKKLHTINEEKMKNLWETVP